MKNKTDIIVSIITICLNSEKNIRCTIESVLEQSYKNIEYIIIDGLSSDNTVNIIREYSEMFDDNLIWSSEKDTGIYNAFNKGLDKCSGDVIYFLNSGDYLIDKEVIEDVVSVFKDEDIDLLFGQVFMGNGHYRNNNVHSLFYLLFRTVCHQAIFARKKCFVNLRFDEGYKWLSDYDWVIKCFKNNKIKKYYMDRVISFFDPANNTGFDNYVLQHERYKERLSIGLKNFSGLYKTLFLMNQFRLNCKLYFEEFKGGR